MPPAAAIDRVLNEIDAARDEVVDFTRELIRVPTVNPPGEAYEDCARLIGTRLAEFGFATDYLVAATHRDHTAACPRVNVVGIRQGLAERPLVHLNGHIDVVPPGGGWTLGPFDGVVRDGRIYGRGACDMKSGIAAAIYAAEALRRAAVPLAGSIEISATVDEESGGFAGMAWLCETGRVSASRVDSVIIPEPLNVDRICVGHRGVYWFELTTHGRVAHGSMPFLGVNAIDQMTAVLDAIQRDLAPTLQTRQTAMPVVPALARRPTINVNAIEGGQPADGVQTPCVADRCRAIFDRRFIPEEGFEQTKREVTELIERVASKTRDMRYDLRDLLVVHPVSTPTDSTVVRALRESIQRVLGRPATLVASPGTYDHKHVARLGGITNCVAYGPGILDVAHQPDEYCDIDDLLHATKVLALAVMDLTGTNVAR